MGRSKQPVAELFFHKAAPAIHLSATGSTQFNLQFSGAADYKDILQRSRCLLSSIILQIHIVGPRYEKEELCTFVYVEYSGLNSRDTILVEYLNPYII